MRSHDEDVRVDVRLQGIDFEDIMRDARDVLAVFRANARPDCGIGNKLERFIDLLERAVERCA